MRCRTIRAYLNGQNRDRVCALPCFRPVISSAFGGRCVDSVLPCRGNICLQIKHLPCLIISLSCELPTPTLVCGVPLTFTIIGDVDINARCCCGRVRSALMHAVETHARCRYSCSRLWLIHAVVTHAHSRDSCMLPFSKPSQIESFAGVGGGGGGWGPPPPPPPPRPTGGL